MWFPPPAQELKTEIVPKAKPYRPDQVLWVKGPTLKLMWCRVAPGWCQAPGDCRPQAFEHLCVQVYEHNAEWSLDFLQLKATA